MKLKHFLSGFMTLCIISALLSGCEKNNFRTGLYVGGRVCDETEKPLENIQVTIKQPKWPHHIIEYTLEDGEYGAVIYDSLPWNNIDIIVIDPSGMYASDSIHVLVYYNSNKTGLWDGNGSAVVKQDFQLKKK